LPQNLDNNLTYLIKLDDERNVISDETASIKVISDNMEICLEETGLYELHFLGL
jgi:hypothetical protein